MKLQRLMPPCWLPIALACAASFGSIHAQPNLFLFESQPDNSVHSATTNPTEFVLAWRDGLRHVIEISGLGIGVFLAAPAGTDLSTGVYTNTVRYPLNGHQPGLTIGYGSRNCVTECGEFNILELETDEAGTIVRLWVTLTNRCDCESGYIRGEIRLNSQMAPPPPLPKTIRVPGDYPTIQSGINAASFLSLDTVLVAPGVYRESIKFNGRPARLVSEAGPAETIIMAPPDPQSTAVLFISGEGADSSISGFTITNSYQGIGSADSSPTVASNVISGCSLGIGATGSPIIRSNIISNCGGAIGFMGTETPLVEGNTIRSNGYAVSMFVGGWPTIQNNIIDGNQSGIDMVNGSEPRIVQNLIVSNLYNGIVAHVPSGCRGPLVANNTIVGNGILQGAGIALDGFYTLSRIMNNVVVGTTTLYASGYARSGLPDLSCNNFFPTNTVNHAGTFTNIAGMFGSISQNPLFACGPGYDFRLLLGSPCIDAGTNGVEHQPLYDFDGQPRIMPGATNAALRVDMGAFEFNRIRPSTPCLFIRCPADFSVTNAPGQNLTAVQYPPPDATPVATVTCSPPSGSLLPAGTNVVRCAAVLGTNVVECAFSVFVLSPPRILAQPESKEVSAGATVRFHLNADGLAPLHYLWFLNGMAIPNATNASLEIRNAQSEDDGVYTALVGNSVDSVVSAPAFLRVLPSAPKLVGFPFSQSFSAGSDVLLEVLAIGTMPLSYQWFRNNQPIARANSQRLILPNAQEVDSADYRVNISNAMGEVTSPSASLHISPAPPGFVLQPESQAAPSGTDVTLSSIARGSEPISYQWLRNGLRLSGATNASLTLSNVDGSAGATYGVVASNFLGSATSVIAALVITEAPPAFVEHPISTNVFVRSPLQLSSLAVGSLPMHYQWYAGSSVLSAQTNRELLLEAISFGDANSYFLTVSNVFGVSTSAVADVVVIGPPEFTKPLTNQMVEAGSTVSLSVSAIGHGPVSYFWQLNGTTLSTLGPVLTLENVQPSRAGWYTAYASSSLDGMWSRSDARIAVVSPQSSVVVWGDNTAGQTNAPAILHDAVMVAGGDFHSVALRSDGSILAWGYNGDGQTNIPVPVSASGFAGIAAGSAHNLAVTMEGGVIAWGRNDHRQAAVPSGLHSVLFVAAGERHSLALNAYGVVTSWGDNSAGQTAVPNEVAYRTVRMIAAGRFHNLACCSDGTVYGWGLNSHGQASPPQSFAWPKAVAAGFLHSVALQSDGTVLAWGDNTFGQTNVPPGLSNVVAIAAGDLHTIALRGDGSIVGWGDNSYGQLNIPSGGPNVSIACGNYHGLALFSSLQTLSCKRASNAIVLEWRGPAVLQWAPTILGPYTDIPNLTGPYTNEMLMPAKFFRLRHW